MLLLLLVPLLLPLPANAPVMAAKLLPPAAMLSNMKLARFIQNVLPLLLPLLLLLLLLAELPCLLLPLPPLT
jgi:hypothetical protein